MNSVLNLGKLGTFKFDSHEDMYTKIQRALFFINPFGADLLDKYPLTSCIESAQCVIVSPATLGYTKTTNLGFIKKLAEAQGYVPIDPLLALSVALTIEFNEGVHYTAVMAPIFVNKFNLVLTMGKSNKQKYIGAYPLKSMPDNVWDPQSQFLMVQS